MTAPRNLADALMDEITRVRDRILPAYLDAGAAGAVAVAAMRSDMDAAVRALAEQDATKCLELYQRLQAWTEG